MGDAIPIPTELLVFVLGGAAWAVWGWVRERIDHAKDQAARNAAKIEDVGDESAEQTVKLSEAVATILQELRDHRRRLDRLEQDTAEGASVSQEIERTVHVNGEQARAAIAEMGAMRAELRAASENIVRLSVQLETHDRHRTDMTAKLDKLYDLFVRGIADAAARQATAPAR